MNETQTPDGRWVPAKPLPYYEDGRRWYIRLWHAGRVLFGADLDDLMEPWWVPVELPQREQPRGD